MLCLHEKDFGRVIHTLLTSCLDYRSSLFIGIDLSALQRLQVVKNVAACILTWQKRCDLISPALVTFEF